MFAYDKLEQYQQQDVAKQITNVQDAFVILADKEQEAAIRTLQTTLHQATHTQLASLQTLQENPTNLDNQRVFIEESKRIATLERDLQTRIQLRLQALNMAIGSLQTKSDTASNKAMQTLQAQRSQLELTVSPPLTSTNQKIIQILQQDPAQQQAALQVEYVKYKTALFTNPFDLPDLTLTVQKLSMWATQHQTTFGVIHTLPSPSINLMTKEGQGPITAFLQAPSMEEKKRLNDITIQKIKQEIQIWQSVLSPGKPIPLPMSEPDTAIDSSWHQQLSWLLWASCAKRQTDWLNHQLAARTMITSLYLLLKLLSLTDEYQAQIPLAVQEQKDAIAELTAVLPRTRFGQGIAFNIMWNNLLSQLNPFYTSLINTVPSAEDANKMKELHTSIEQTLTSVREAVDTMNRLFPKACLAEAARLLESFLRCAKTTDVCMLNELQTKQCKRNPVTQEIQGWKDELNQLITSLQVVCDTPPSKTCDVKQQQYEQALQEATFLRNALPFLNAAVIREWGERQKNMRMHIVDENSLSNVTVRTPSTSISQPTTEPVQVAPPIQVAPPAQTEPPIQVALPAQLAPSPISITQPPEPISQERLQTIEQQLKQSTQKNTCDNIVGITGKNFAQYLQDHKECEKLCETKHTADPRCQQDSWVSTEFTPPLTEPQKAIDASQDWVQLQRARLSLHNQLVDLYSRLKLAYDALLVTPIDETKQQSLLRETEVLVQEIKTNEAEKLKLDTEWEQRGIDYIDALVEKHWQKVIDSSSKTNVPSMTTVLPLSSICIQQDMARNLGSHTTTNWLQNVIECDKHIARTCSDFPPDSEEKQKCEVDALAIASQNPQLIPNTDTLGQKIADLLVQDNKALLAYEQAWNDWVAAQEEAKNALTQQGNLNVPEIQRKYLLPLYQREGSFFLASQNLAQTRIAVVQLQTELDLAVLFPASVNEEFLTAEHACSNVQLFYNNNTEFGWTQSSRKLLVSECRQCIEGTSDCLLPLAFAVLKASHAKELGPSDKLLWGKLLAVQDAILNVKTIASNPPTTLKDVIVWQNNLENLRADLLSFDESGLDSTLQSLPFASSKTLSSLDDFLLDVNAQLIPGTEYWVEFETRLSSYRTCLNQFPVNQEHDATALQFCLAGRMVAAKLSYDERKQKAQSNVNVILEMQNSLLAKLTDSLSLGDIASNLMSRLQDIANNGVVTDDIQLLQNVDTWRTISMFVKKAKEIRKDWDAFIAEAAKIQYDTTTTRTYECALLNLTPDFAARCKNIPCYSQVMCEVVSMWLKKEYDDYTALVQKYQLEGNEQKLLYTSVLQRIDTRILTAQKLQLRNDITTHDQVVNAVQGWSTTLDEINATTARPEMTSDAPLPEEERTKRTLLFTHQTKLRAALQELQEYHVYKQRADSRKVIPTVFATVLKKEQECRDKFANQLAQYDVILTLRQLTQLPPPASSETTYVPVDISDCPKEDTLTKSETELKQLVQGAENKTTVFLAQVRDVVSSLQADIPPTLAKTDLTTMVETWAKIVNSDRIEKVSLLQSEEDDEDTKRLVGLLQINNSKLQIPSKMDAKPFLSLLLECLQWLALFYRFWTLDCKGRTTAYNTYFNTNKPFLNHVKDTLVTLIARPPLKPLPSSLKLRALDDKQRAVMTKGPNC